ncbi:50S ribosomal protein L5 [Candidatus Velamenicoccus archaeovorus]|uniref:Large ribosomal subunit protein uL5 n=1 Tax=Velamenicoccus archaeovorus TaxID=1930593 RepID=A0A410P3Q5_VELA1|nr:50S ribosomal protein L5 [Candidatus Velamenicoccus archaeovorus]QAT16799.1 50S ribosomal protein L5 [Candidatus Velamenicoccus archaeovorus]
MAENKTVPRLLEKYRKEVVPELMKIIGYKNALQAPRLKKIVINMGVGEAIQDIKMLEKSVEELGMITGQKPVITRSKKAIANFKIKKAQAIGCMVTLRRQRMYEFMDRLISVALPRIRDFRGVNPKSFDAQGNFTIGITEQAIFPEVDVDKIARVQGMDVTFVIASSSQKESYEFLRLMGIPFSKTDKSS